MTELDHALARFHFCAPEFAGGLTNHGPMVAESLHVLGHDALIAAWVDIYSPRLEDAVDGRIMPVSARFSALGGGAFADWSATFRAELEASPWRSVLGEWLPELLPGYFARATHGPIRTAHAVRSLEEEDSGIRRLELAEALAYWAAGFRRLPGVPGADSEPGLGALEILTRVPIVEARDRRPGFLTDAIEAIPEQGQFARLLAKFDPGDAPPLGQLAEVCAEITGLYLANPRARMAYIHALTGTSALRLLAPYLNDDALRAGLGFALQAAAALHATFCDSTEGVEPDAERDALSDQWDELRYRAACSLAEHVIKVTETCWRENLARPHPNYGRVAADAVLNLGISRGGRGA
ncbi:MAG: hypothetical protein OSB70_10355 [Myxococcota bacterium]|nr:hypothetical protein [Myxococcota bacterium]